MTTPKAPTPFITQRAVRDSKPAALLEPQRVEPKEAHH